MTTRGPESRRKRAPGVPARGAQTGSNELAELARAAARAELQAWHAKRLSAAVSMGDLAAYQSELDALRGLATSRTSVAHALARQIVRMGFDFAAVQLVSGAAVESVAAVGCAAAWAPMARHPLRRGPLDIHASIIRDGGHAEEIAGWSPLFDRQIFDRFGHEPFRRVFAPIVVHFGENGALGLGHRCVWQVTSDLANNRVARLCHTAGCRPTVIGTVEAGVMRDRGAFTPETLGNLLQTCSGWTNAVFRESLPSFLANVTQLGRDLLDADSCTCHFSRVPDVFFMDREAAYPAARRRRRADGTIGGS